MWCVRLALFVFLLSSIGMISGQTTPARDPNPIIRAPVGRIKGSLLQTRLGKPIFSFRAIRYAEPPVGEQRFKEAIPAKDWSNVFDATQEGPSCPRREGKSMSEDCLRLNVYTTALPHAGQPRINRPVIVFFHPGGFYGFSGQSSEFGPQYLLDKNIVLVTLNYRLSSLGFISTGDELAPGNLGLKDQVVALKWIKRNIAAFGGDPRSVTITGDSAGAWSVILHMLSPLSKGLFHRAIAMSGAPTIHDLLPRDQKHLAIKQAQLLNCTDTSSTRAILDCLKTKSMDDFVNTLPGFAEWYGDPILVWRPVIEPESLGDKRFLTGQPIDLIRQKKINEVPLICGVTQDEFGGVLAGLIELFEKNDPAATAFSKELEDNWERIAPISFIYERNTSRSREISQALRKFFLNDQPLTLNNIQGLSDLYADAHITFSTHRMAKLMAENSREPVYFYKFTYQGRYSFNTYSNSTPYGVAHHDDLQYVFYMSRFPFFEKGAPEIQMVEKLTNIWGNFVNFDKPTRRHDPVQWKKYSPREDNYMEINTQLAMKKGIFPARMRFWDNLFPLPPLPPQH